MDHLTNNAKTALSLSDKERKLFINGYKWIGYTRAQEVLEGLNDLVDSPRTTRMPNILLVGSSNNGKTVIIDKFADQHPQYFDEEKEEIRQPVLKIETPPQADEVRLYQQILKTLYIPFRSNHKASTLLDQVTNAFKHLHLKVLVIDEIHHLLVDYPKGRKQITLNALKSLSNTLSISIVAVGVSDAFHVFQSDPQMASRFETVPLPRWTLNKEYVRFLISYEKTLPLRNQSNLFEKDIAIKILSLTDGTIGGISKVLKKAAIKAIESGNEQITCQLIDSLGIMHPDEHRKMPNL